MAATFKSHPTSYCFSNSLLSQQKRADTVYCMPKLFLKSPEQIRCKVIYDKNTAQKHTRAITLLIMTNCTIGTHYFYCSLFQLFLVGFCRYFVLFFEYGVCKTTRQNIDASSSDLLNFFKPAWHDQLKHVLMYIDITINSFRVI